MYPRRQCVLAVFILAVHAVAQHTSQTTRYPATPVVPHDGDVLTAKSMLNLEPLPLVAPIFIEDAHNSSSLVIANSTAVNAGATISVRNLAGAEIGTIYKKLAPHEQQEIALHSLLAQFSSNITVGSVTVTQDANLNGMAVASQLLLTRSTAASPSYLDEELVMPSIGGSPILRGVADQAEGEALVAIASTVKWEQHITLRCLSEKSESKSAVIALGPFATSLVSGCAGQTVTDLNSYEKGVSEHAQQGILGYELTSDGGQGTIAAFGLAPHLRNHDVVFSSILFLDPAEIHSPNSVFAGVPFGVQQDLPDGVYEPRITFANFASAAAHLKVSIATTLTGATAATTAPGDSPEKVTIRQLTIAPRRSVDLALSDGVTQKGLLQSLFVESDRQPGEVLGKAVSRSDGNLFEVELLQKDEMDENNGGIHPWSVEGDTESHLLLFNHSKAPQVFGVGISNGAILWDKKYTLAPNETREISINQLIQDKVSDDKGKELDAAHESGVVNWMVPDFGNATGRLMVTSRSRGIARNFSCGNTVVVCALDFSLFDYGLLGDGTTSDLWYAAPLFCSAPGPGACVTSPQIGSGSATYTWTIGASTIVIPSNNSQLTVSAPNVTGVGPGSGSGKVAVEAGGCQSNGSGPANVTPTVSISLGSNGTNIVTGASGQPRTSTQLTATGKPSGGAFQWKASSSAVSLTGSTSGTVTASAGAAGQATLTVTYTYNQQSASASQQVTVQQPGGYSVSSDLGNQPHQCLYIDGSPAYTGVQHTINYQLLDSSNPGVPIKLSGIAMTESFSTISDGCKLGQTPTTADGPTLGGGQWVDGFVMCTSNCNPSNSTYTPNCQSTFNHTWSANGQQVLNRTVTYGCSSITP